MLVGWVLAVSAINWGLVGLLGVNLVETVFGDSIITKIVYILIGAVGVYKVYMMTMMKKK